MKKLSLFTISKNIITASALISMLLQVALPFTYVTPAYAQVATVTPTDTTTPTPTDTVTTTPTDTVTPTDTSTPTPTDTVSPTVTQDQVSPTPTDNGTSVTPTDTAVPTPSINSTPTAGDSAQTPASNDQNNHQSQGPPSNQSSPTVTVSPTPTDAPSSSSLNGQVNTTIVKNVSAPTLDLTSTTSNGSATITTNKADYSPTDTAVITGVGFLPNKSYTLEIVSTDAPAVDFVTTITTNDQGSFTYAYQLDGNNRENYTVYVKNGNEVVATTGFTDSQTITSLKLNGSTSVNVTPGASLSVAISVTLTAQGTTSWESTGWKIGSGTETCINTTTNYTTAGTYNENFTITAPSTAGTYNFIATIYANACNNGGTGSHTSTTLSNAITVSASPTPTTTPTATPTLTPTVTPIPTSTPTITPTPTTTSGNTSVNLDQYANSPSNAWQNGDLNKTNSSYKEGESVPFRLHITGLTPGTHTINLNYDFTSGGVYSYDYLTTYNKSYSVSPCDSISTTLCNSSVTASVPVDSDTKNQPSNQVITVFGGNGTPSLGSYTLSGPITGNSTKNVVLTFSTAGTEVLIAWSGHIASSLDYGSGLGAGSVSGAPFHMRTQSLDGAGNQNQDKSIQPGGILIPAEITIQKNVDTNGDGISDRTATAGEWSFSLDGGTPVPTDSNGQVVFTNVSDGSHTITESNGPSGYAFVSGSGTNCTFNSSTATATVAAGNPSPKNATCTFLNGIQTGTLVVHKTFTDSHSNQGITIDLSGTATGSAATDAGGNATFSNLSAGTYSAVAEEPAGYYASATTCTNVPVTAGQQASCTITDSPILGTITVHKDVVGTTTNLNQFCFTLNPDPGIGQVCADSTTGNAVFNNVPTGTYTASETASATGYTQTGTTCDTGMSITNNGDTATCTITNTRDTGTIELQKVWSGTAGQTTLNIGTTAGASDVAGVQTGANGGTPLTTGAKTVDTGTYYVSEDSSTLGNYSSVLSCADNGQSITPGADNSVTVNKGDIIVCTFTNTRNTGTIELTKVWSGGTDTTTLNIGTTVGGSEIASAQVTSNGTTGTQTVDTGTYYVSESSLADYSSSLSCTDNGSTTTLGANNAVTVNTGDVVVCTFTNTRNTADLQAVKVVDDGSDLTQWSFALDNGTPVKADSKGVVDFGQVTTDANHTIAESGPTGYHLVSITGTNCLSNNDGSSGTVNIPNGTSSATCTFTNNRDTGTITVHKLVDTTGTGNFSGDDTTANGLGFTWSVDGAGTNAFGATVSGATTLVAHEINENINYFYGEYHFIGWYDNSGKGSCANPDGTTLPADVTLANNGDSKTITLCNARDTGTLRIEKVVEDAYGNVVNNDPTLFTFNVSQNNTSFGQANIAGGGSQDFTLPTDMYDVTENAQSGYTLLGCIPNEDEYESLANGVEASVTTDSTVTVVCTNQQTLPVLTINKFNNTEGANKNPGDLVLYTITVTATQSAANNVTVTDLLPKGFTYQSGSWTANVTGGSDPETCPSGDLKACGITTEPTYHSPGTWQLGDMSIGETITLTLLAKVGDIQPGDYKDVAYAQGDSLASNQVFANADSGVFVGTDVNVVNDKPIASYNAINTVTQTVLGASIGLPDTGANTYWIDFAISLLLLGVSAVMIGLYQRRKYNA